uniref:Uncharacterized protein n=1 Tax=Utricularia reniformis TaxID=192314 RepID=A0A1Y0B006_9LAMI|nr:hypothetical protein AEK19_MT0472 [Utricularia reniformis]ART30730.1 hypothetical protein AEK19_MT0472 [Utricularia reniformis]
MACCFCFIKCQVGEKDDVRSCANSTCFFFFLVSRRPLEREGSIEFDAAFLPTRTHSSTNLLDLSCAYLPPLEGMGCEPELFFFCFVEDRRI